jgi:hypothetical protein
MRVTKELTAAVSAISQGVKNAAFSPAVTLRPRSLKTKPSEPIRSPGSRSGVSEAHAG